MFLSTLQRDHETYLALKCAIRNNDMDQVIHVFNKYSNPIPRFILEKANMYDENWCGEDINIEMGKFLICQNELMFCQVLIHAIWTENIEFVTYLAELYAPDLTAEYLSVAIEGNDNTYEFGVVDILCDIGEKYYTTNTNARNNITYKCGCHGTCTEELHKIHLWEYVTSGKALVASETEGTNGIFEYFMEKAENANDKSTMVALNL